MSENILPVNEELGLKIHIDYEYFNSPAENSFNNISNIAAGIFEASCAGICLFNDDDVFIKAQTGDTIEIEILKPLISLNSSTIDFITLNNGNLELQNTGYNFFVAAPINSIDGYTIGAIYVCDLEAKETNQQKINMLMQLAELAVDKLETKTSIRKTLTAQDDRLHVLIHDLKNPMTTISLQSELVSRIPNVNEKVALIASKINIQSKKMVDSLNEILSSAKKEKGSYKPQKVKVDLREILNSVVEKLNLYAVKKNQSFTSNIDTALEIYGDVEKLTELFYQLIHNSIKFSGNGTNILLTHLAEENLITIAIKDQGVGLTAEDLDKVFIKFAKLSADATQQENSNGLGLILVKMLVDMHKGKLWVESEGKNLGTTFFVQLPIK